MSEVIKTCGCGKSYAREGWDALEHLPNWVYDWGEVQEVRNCTCGSTLVVVIVEGEPGSMTPATLPENPKPVASRFDRV